MIEVNWGETITLYAPKYKKIEHFRTIEKAQYWLRCKWPEMTTQRSEALLKTQLAMDCLIPVGEAKNAFITAAHAAGYSTRTATQMRVFLNEHTINEICLFDGRVEADPTNQGYLRKMLLSFEHAC